ncbi:MAG: CHAT domain-containing protein [Deltaproteobacteria bacterium]|jgi:CHAT domain-containing protein/tetratricopeptide (TPR) repeat protein|nr:CHAT domain-containing protein [Deltaproteobacteria bacterium]
MMTTDARLPLRSPAALAGAAAFLALAAALVLVSAAAAQSQRPGGELDSLSRDVSRLERELGPDHGDVLAAKTRLADALRAMGEIAQARDVAAGVAESMARTLGPDDPLTLESESALAEDLFALGDYTGSYGLHLRILEARVRLLGPSDPLALQSKTELAEDLKARGKFAEALEMHSRVAEARERLLGEAHADTLASKNRMAHCLSELGEYEAARDLLTRVLELTQRNLGPDNPETLRSKAVLAAVLGQLGDYAAARELHEEVLATRVRKVGPDHVLTQQARSNLGFVLADIGDFEDARILFAQALEGMERARGKDHPGNLIAKSNLASTYSDLGDHATALELFSQARETALRVLEPDHPLALMTGANLAEALHRNGKPEAAMELYSEILKSTELALGASHLQTLSAKSDMAMVLSDLGDYDSAAELQLQVLENSTRRYGSDHPASAMAAGKLGKIYLNSGDTERAVFFLKLSVDSTQRLRGKLSSLDSELRGAFLKSVEFRYHDLYDALMKAGRPEGALAVMGLLKDDELREMVSAPEGPDGPGTEPEVPDLFTGTPEEGAHAAFAEAAQSEAAVGREHAALMEKRGTEGLSGEEERRLAVLNARMGESAEAFLNVCDSLPSLLAGGEGREASRVMLELQSRQKTIGEMGEGTVVLHAVSTDRTLYLMLLTPYAIVTRESDVGREELERLVSEFRALLTDPSRDPRPQGARLFDLVVRPLLGELRGAGARTIMLSLDGTLRYVPLAALWDGERWLAESYPTAIFTQSSVDKLRAESPGDGASARALGVTEGHPGFPALPGVAEEIVGIVGADGPGTPGTGVLAGEFSLDAEFTREALSRSLSSGAPVIHVASHFRLDPANHRNTVLLLGDGTTLSLREIASGPDLDFRGLDLLTLSACDTASATRRSDGMEVESFGEVVQRLGAAAVLASLWPVEDRSTAGLMREFYRLRYVEGLDKARALQGAQLMVMRDTTSVARPSPAGPAAAGEAGGGGAAGGTGSGGGGGAAGAGTGDRAGETASAGGPGKNSPGDLSPDAAGRGRPDAAREVSDETALAGTRGSGIRAGGSAPGGAPAAAPRWVGGGFSHPYFWAPFIVMGVWR